MKKIYHFFLIISCLHLGLVNQSFGAFPVRNTAIKTFTIDEQYRPFARQLKFNKSHLKPIEGTGGGWGMAALICSIAILPLIALGVAVANGSAGLAAILLLLGILCYPASFIMGIVGMGQGRFNSGLAKTAVIIDIAYIVAGMLALLVAIILLA